MPILDMISEITKIVKADGIAKSVKLPSPSLDHYLWIGDPSEEPADVKVVVDEYYYRPFQPVKAREASHNLEIIGVDSSSRTIETYSHVVLLGAAAASSRYRTVEISIPNIESTTITASSQFTKKIKPYIILPRGETHTSSTQIPHDTREEGFLDILRFSLENQILRDILNLPISGGTVVMVDGPIINGALISKASHDGSGIYKKLLYERAELIASLEEKGVPVLGFVKRVEHSSLIHRSQGLRVLLEKCSDRRLPASDAAVLELALVSGCAAWRASHVLRTLALRVSYKGGYEKLAEYIVLPTSPVKLIGPKTRIYRLEYTSRSREILGRFGLKPHTLLVDETILRGSITPVTIARSDRRARSLTAALRKTLSSSLVLEGVPQTHTSLMEGMQ